MNSLPEALPAIVAKLDSLSLYIGHWPSLALHDRKYSTAGQPLQPPRAPLS
jgi:hypothetical protein